MKQEKTNTSAWARIRCLLLLIALLILFPGTLAKLIAPAQSSKGNPARTSIPKATPPTGSPNQGSANRNLIDRNAEAYRLVYATSPGLSSFVEQINKAGEQGYMLVSTVYRWQRKSASTKSESAAPVAILKLDEVQHEYASFETIGKRDLAITDFEQTYKELSNRGFRLVDHFLLDKSCHYNDTFESDVCDRFHYLFLVEREKGVEKPTQFILARGNLNLIFKVITPAKLAAQIKQKLAEGFYPTDLLSEPVPAIVLTQTENTRESSDSSPDIQVVLFCEDSRKRLIAHFAKQGYRLALLDMRAAVMYRYGQTVAPLTYIWLRVNGKSLDEQLAKLQATGAIYRMAYTDEGSIKDQVVFEQGVVGPRGEYKVLDFEFQVVEDLKKGGEREVHIDLTPAAKERLTLLNALANKGFRVRDIFANDRFSDKVRILLERENTASSGMPTNRKG